MSTSGSAVSLVLLLAACGSVLHAQTPAVALSGPSQIRLGGAGQYSALVNGAPGAVVWSVNGYAGGVASTGPISTTGFYTPAATFYAGHSVTISATTVAKPGGTASLSVKVLNPLPVISSGSVTQTAPGSSFVLTVNGSGFVSGSQLEVAGANVATTLVSPTELQSNIGVTAGTTSISVGVLNPNAAQKAAVTQTIAVQTIPPVSLAEATRLVDQTTFGRNAFEPYRAFSRWVWPLTWLSSLPRQRRGCRLSLIRRSRPVPTGRLLVRKVHFGRMRSRRTTSFASGSHSR